MLSMGGVLDIDDHQSVDDAADYEATTAGLESCGCTASERRKIAALAAGLLHLSQLRFAAPEADGGVVDIHGEAQRVADAIGVDGGVLANKLRTRSEAGAGNGRFNVASTWVCSFEAIPKRGKRPRFEFVPRDDRSSKNRADRDTTV